jgi:hypothetical protein
LKTADLYISAYIQLTTKQPPTLKLDANKRIYFLFPGVNEDEGQRFYTDSPVPVASYVAILKALKSRMFNEKEQLGGFGHD